MAIVFLIIGIVLSGGALYVLVKDLRGYIKNPKTNSLDRKSKFRWTAALFGLAFAGGFLQASVNVFNQWPMTNYQASLSICGAALFFLFFGALWSSFYVHFYKSATVSNQAKWIKRMMIGAIPLSVLAFLILGEGVAEHLSYPFISGFSICSQGWVWTNIYSNTTALGGVHIAFYGIIMVFSAVVVYWICDHEFYKEFHKHGILDSALLVLFPAGVVGGRIGYVIGNWEDQYAGTVFKAYGFKHYFEIGEWYRMFEVWNGGLTILGGALGGIIAGLIFFRWRRKYVNIRWAMDVVIPTILVAQAIGRWGNFFNHEVYGASVSMFSWNFLPTWLRYQMSTSFSGGIPDKTSMFVPLFLIEGVCNLAGYFIIKYAIGKPLKKWLSKGDLAAGYMIWYGLVRFIMEPMRDSTYNMGATGQWSVIWSLIYVAIGVLMVVFFHVLDFVLLRKRQKEDEKAILPSSGPTPASSTQKEIPSEPQKGVDKPLEAERKDKK